jgi:hypothetical protein
MAYRKALRPVTVGCDEPRALFLGWAAEGREVTTEHRQVQYHPIQLALVRGGRP